MSAHNSFVYSPVDQAVTANSRQAATVLQQRAKEIPFYQDCVGSIEEDADWKAKLGRFPVVNKEILSTAGADLYAQPERMIALFSETSGTSGRGPLLTPRGRDDFRWNSYNQARAYRRHLVPGQDRVAILHPVVMSPFAEASAWALKEMGIGYLRIFPIPHICDYSRIARILDDYRITSIMTTATLAYKLLFELQKLDHLPPYLDKLLLTGEHLTRTCLDNFDRIIDRGAGVARSFVYGSSEAATLMYGTEDSTYRGYLDDFIFEISSSGESWEQELADSVPPGAVTGRLLVTWLQDGVLPLVRYDAGDAFSSWCDPASGEWKFQSHGRLRSDGISPAMASQIDEICFGSHTPIVYYELAVSSGGSTLTCFTFTEKEDNSELHQELSDKLARLLNCRVDIEINPEVHAFLEFSPLAKTNRIEVIQDVAQTAKRASV